MMILAELRRIFDTHNTRPGIGWTLTDTRGSLHQKLKYKLEANGRDSATAKPPCNITVLLYNAVCMSTHDVVVRACNPIVLYYEAAETFVRSMVTLVCAILCAMAYVL